MPSHAEGQIFRDIEGVLIHGHGRAHAVRPGHQGASADADLDQRERRVRPASIQESLVAHDQLVLGAPGHRRGPDQARCVRGRKTLTGNRGEGVDVVGTTRIDEVPAVAVGVVVRQLEVAARAELHGDFGEHVLRWEMPVRGPKRARLKV